MAAAGLEVSDVESLRRHYAETCRLWADRLDANRERALELAGERRLRILADLPGRVRSRFAHGWMDIHQILACKSVDGDAGGLPWTRDYMYAAGQAKDF